MICETRARQRGLPELISGDRCQDSAMTALPVSPALLRFPTGSLPAYEVKFLLTEETAQQLERELRTALQPDPHGLAGRYTTTTLYCDTPAFDIFHRRLRSKCRLRRYGDLDRVFLERKSKRGDRVRKRRADVPLADVVRLETPDADAVWDGQWFHRRVLQRQLAPVLAVMYDRTAYFGAGEHGPIRLTFDRAVRGTIASGWQVAPFTDGEPVLSDTVIGEFKFRGPMPTLFKRVIESHQLLPGSASKYRLCAAALELAVSPQQ